MGENRLALKCISEKIKCFMTIHFFYGKPGHRYSFMENSNIYLFKPPLIESKFCPLFPLNATTKADHSSDLEIILSFLAAWLARQKISAKYCVI